MYFEALNPNLRSKQQKSYLRVYDDEIWYHYGFQAAEFNNDVRSVILLKIS